MQMVELARALLYRRNRGGGRTQSHEERHGIELRVKPRSIGIDAEVSGTSARWENKRNIGMAAEEGFEAELKKLGTDGQTV
jgi:hypothetical protein